MRISDWSSDVCSSDLPIIAARGGVIIKTENEQTGRGDDPAGNFVRVLHDDGTMGVYLHLQKGSVSVREGQRVGVGTPLALSGNTGNSPGPHLHRSEERRVGKECVSTCGSGGSQGQ